MLADNKIDTIVHFAAESHVDRSILGPGLFVQTNIVGTYTMLEAARKVWLGNPDFEKNSCRFHHISTDEVFGTLNPGEPAWKEETSYAPSSPYSASKPPAITWCGPTVIRMVCRSRMTNCSNNYGPYQFPEKLIPLIILNAYEGKPLPVYGDGQQIRDWLHVEDHCEAIYLVLTKGQVGSSYNIGGNNQPANLTIVETICGIMDELAPAKEPHRNLITYVKDRPGHDRRYAMDSSKIESDLGWQRKHTLKEGLLDTVKWYLDHPDWVKAIREQSNFNTWVNQNYSDRK
jgi:dTDP-glucose 4,6-dehydratase